jgi:hypothetical protein
MLSCFLHCRRLVARTLPFQGGEAGSIPVDSTKQLGAVVGYGVALQASCLEGFDSLGLHQFYLFEALSGCVHGLGPCGLGSNPSRETNFYASETWKSERSYTPFSARLAFLREFDPLRWYQFRMRTANSKIQLLIEK